MTYSSSVGRALDLQTNRRGFVSYRSQANFSGCPVGKLKVTHSQIIWSNLIILVLIVTLESLQYVVAEDSKDLTFLIKAAGIIERDIQVR